MSHYAVPHTCPDMATLQPAQSVFAGSTIAKARKLAGNLSVAIAAAQNPDARRKTLQERTHAGDAGRCKRRGQRRTGVSRFGGRIREGVSDQWSHAVAGGHVVSCCQDAAAQEQEQEQRAALACGRAKIRCVPLRALCAGVAHQQPTGHPRDDCAGGVRRDLGRAS